MTNAAADGQKLPGTILNRPNRSNAGFHCFAANPGRVFPRKYLLEKIWDYSYEGYDRTVDSHINRLRAKIEENPEKLTSDGSNRLGIGYKFSDEQ